jgi:hypothetical protein
MFEEAVLTWIRQSEIVRDLWCESLVFDGNENCFYELVDLPKPIRGHMGVFEE